MTPRLPAFRAAAALAGLVVLVLTCATAQGATLVGGREQSKLATAFFARGAHQGLVIVSTRASTVKRTWIIVKYVRPTRVGGTGVASAPVKLKSAFYHLVGARVKAAAKPPAAVRADLMRPFSVAVVYTGSGSETIAYKQPYKGVCAGAGGFTDEQDDTVAPMSWSVRYVVDLDDLQSAVRGSAGTALVPEMGLYRSQSKITARQTLTRTAIDESCNGKPTTFTCRMTYAGPANDGLLTLPPSGGLEVGVPITSTGVGDCDPSDYTLGPSLWDSGATTASVAPLGLVGGTLPTNPYAPVKVSWPSNGVALSQGFIASPCQGDGLSCRDAFHWTGQVVLQPLG